MMYGSRNVKCYRQNFLWFLTVFCPFTLVIILHMCTINNNHMMHGSWDMTHDRCKCYFSFWAIFCPFTPLTAQKIKILKKWKKHLEISSFYICVPKIMIRRCMVPEISCMTNVIVISHFGLFFALLPPNNPKNQNFEKMKKTPRDIIILHMCTINDNHMMYGSWDMEHDRQNFLSFWTIFCPFTPLTTQKIKILKKWKKHLEISFYICVPKIMIRCMVPEIWCVTDVIAICHFGLFFALLPPLTA